MNSAINIETSQSWSSMEGVPDWVELPEPKRPAAKDAGPRPNVVHRSLEWLGQVLAGPHFDGEGILTADLDMGEIARGKYDFDVAGHYARPDVFRLFVKGSKDSPELADVPLEGRPTDEIGLVVFGTHPDTACARYEGTAWVRRASPSPHSSVGRGSG